ncbi:unnamed protein product, partial [Pylaiella littoralis]
QQFGVVGGWCRKKNHPPQAAHQAGAKGLRAGDVAVLLRGCFLLLHCCHLARSSRFTSFPLFLYSSLLFDRQSGVPHTPLNAVLTPPSHLPPPPLKRRAYPVKYHLRDK